jgi:Transglycosylase SLT domain
MRRSRSAVFIFLLSQAITAPAMAGQHKTSRGGSPAVVASPLDRVAFAVDGAESSHGADGAMWRADPTGPQGPMQVSEAAAIDVGGGDRFDTAQNRAIGRAYLAQLYQRYGDWPDAIAAYNWGIGNLAAWVRAGRPAGGSASGVAAYTGRVLHDSGLCDGSPAKPLRVSPVALSNCADAIAWEEAVGRSRLALGVGEQRFYGQLDKALRLAAQRAPRAER